MRRIAFSVAHLSDTKTAMCIIVLLAGFGFYSASHRSPLPKPKPPMRSDAEWHGLPNYLEDPQAGRKQVELLAKKSGGDFGKLNQNEQTWLNSVTAGNGARMLAMKARELRMQQHEARPARPLSHNNHRHAA